MFRADLHCWPELRAVLANPAACLLPFLNIRLLLRMQPMSITLTAAVGTSAHGTGDVVITSPGLGTTTRVRG